MNSKTRAYLKSLAHPIKATVMVGKGGVDERIYASLDESLASHELVKVKFQALKDQVRPLSEELASNTGSDLVSVIGFIATFYRPSEERLIVIPKELQK
ncbi:MAG TPA: YhbY family RNA-binding protein [Sphaerochaeta sp.]|jgi:RNA-binding protein|nr:YhbY family RNA-binding protein [Sphaerochaeta sp.]